MRMRARILAGVMLLITLCASGAAQVRPVYSRGAAGLWQVLGELQTTASALYTGAHPDDENTSLITRLARGDHARVAYLALTRGEGGQNALGPELQEALGVIRTEELLQARTLDGGGQFFTRLFDYGYSKTLEEAKEKWDEEQALADMVRVIRTYRPLVVISGFSGTPADGHGQHQFAGYLTPLAFRAAGDPKRFPEQLQEGLRPWQPLKLYVSEGYRGGGTPTLEIETGTYDPLLGRTYTEIASEGRSQHKSQEMGMLELRGPHQTGLTLVENKVGPVGPERELFQGVDISIRGITRLAGLPPGVIDDDLEAIQASAEKAMQAFRAVDPLPVIAPLAEGLRRTRVARAKLQARLEQDAAYAEADFLLSRKQTEFEQALRRAAGGEVDALADKETVAPGGNLRIAVRVFLPEGSQVKVKDYRVLVPQGWKAEPASTPPAPTGRAYWRREDTPNERFFQVSVPLDTAITTPYWLRLPRKGLSYQWPEDSPKGQPFAPPLLQGEVELEIAGVTVPVRQAVEYRIADDIRGELRREVNVVPDLTVSLDPQLLIVGVNGPHEQQVTARVCNYRGSGSQGSIVLQTLVAWPAEPATAPFSLDSPGLCTTSLFKVTIPAGTAPGSYEIQGVASRAEASFRQDMQKIEYPHIQTHRLYRPAKTQARVFELKVAPVRVGYIMGSGDEVPEAIRRMGLSVTLLGEKDLATGDFSRFDTIVVGIRAALVRPDFVANHDRLLDFARTGGTLIVQYQPPDYAGKRLPPYPAEIGRSTPGRARVTREDAAIRILEPEHPVFNFPNHITQADFDGWVQERSLYDFTSFSDEYVPLLESHDPGDPPERGGEVWTKVGKGNYIYTSYSWFRQLPAGVPGAYRLFANVLSLPKAPKP